MIRTINLANEIKTRLPGELVEFMQQAGNTAAAMEQQLYLVGGVVRDLLLKRTNLDLDLVADCDAISLAETLARLKNGKVIAHSRFNTAKIKWNKWSVDIATARCESYERPGALPRVQCKCDIKDDLIRRDFTINAMAVSLNPGQYGEVIDLYGGRMDLEHGLIRVLHEGSFKDDATRIWRAVRYEQRLGFKIEHQTLLWLKRDISYLDTISGDRIRHEIELCLEEEKPEKVFLRAQELGLLARICPAFKADEWAARKISKARGVMQPYCPPKELYLAFLVYHMSLKDLENLVTYLNFPQATAKSLLDTLKLKNELADLENPELPPSRIYHILHKYSQDAILANLLAVESRLIQEKIKLYLNQLRRVQTYLRGNDLKELGITSGPQIREMLEILHEARLDGKVSTREDEVRLVQQTDRVAH
jgi:tRNA nucleotidyltransferase (CCA-adding enzyme)